MKRIESSPALRQWRLIVLIPLLVLAGGLAASGQATQPANQSTQGPRPGASDPLGKPGRYTILPSHELLAVFPNGPNGNQYQMRPYAADNNLNLAPLQNGYSYSSDPNANQLYAAAGRILAPGLNRDDKYDQIVFARRSGSSVAVGFHGPATLAPSLVIPGLADRVQNSADFIAVKAGDLDKVPDASGNNHDEVVVVYAAAGAGNQFAVTLKVLDYTSDAADPYPTPIAVTSATTAHAINGNNFAAAKAPGSAQSAILPVDNVLAAAIGDFDGDAQNEIAVLSLENARTSWLTLFRYTNDGAGKRALRQVGETSYSDSAGVFFANAATVDLAAGDFNGDGRDELATANVIWVGDDTAATNIIQYVTLRTWQSDTQFKLTQASVLRLNDKISAAFSDLASRVRVQLAGGLFRFEPDQNFGLGRRQLALAWNRPLSIGGALELDLFTINDKLSLEGARATLALPLEAHQRFALAAGALRGNDSLNEAGWSLVVG
ncbi:MAG: FG-GAP repeat domain-containing protein, partial [Blastocatellia bacterium]